MTSYFDKLARLIRGLNDCRRASRRRGLAPLAVYRLPSNVIPIPVRQCLADPRQRLRKVD